MLTSVRPLMLMARTFLHLILTINIIKSRNMNSVYNNRIEACNSLNCDISSKKTVCGVRYKNASAQVKLFSNECALLKYGCSVANNDAYGLISMDYCKRSDIVNMNSITKRNKIVVHNSQPARSVGNNINCRITCNYLDDAVMCGIRQDGEGYRVRLFENKCALLKNNCNTTTPFIQTDMFICKGTLEANNSASYNAEDANIFQEAGTSQSIIVVDGSMLGQTSDANETIENFFAATHVLDLPIKEVDEVKTRRMLLKNAGPVKVFKPWITIPKEIKTDYYHTPTLSTCYHKCPTQCPDTYSPVCGVPGILAREPSIMFQNHCYMDVAQCKMYWENKSSTAISSSYIESSFLFCLGDQLNGMYRFLPLIKTLQHMGRLKKKGKFHYRLNNMRFFNNYAYKEPKLMG